MPKYYFKRSSRIQGIFKMEDLEGDAYEKLPA